MFLQNNIYLSRRIFFLLIFFSTYSFSSYKSIYNIENPKFKYSIENNNYKVYLSEEGIIDYKTRNGFKLFLPNFTKEYNLGVLRFNSIGRIDGYLATSKFINQSNIIDVEGDDIKYYITNYSTKGQKQLDFLLNGKIIPYIDKTSLAFQGYNIPTKINKHLNKWVYFTFNKNNSYDNKLKYLIYSYSMILDKKLVDNFVKKNFRIKRYDENPKFNYLYTYISNMSKLKYYKYNKISFYKKKITKVIKKTRVIKRKHRTYVRLNLKRLLYMKEFGFENKPIKSDSNQKENKKNKKYDELKSYVKDLQNTIENIKIPNGYFDMITNFDKYNSQLKKIINLNKKLTNEIDYLDYSDYDKPKKNNNQCYKFDTSLNKKCLNNNVYVNNYIYYAIKRDNLPSEELILGYGNGKIFNDIAKYYFERGDYKKSEKYLLRAYPLLDGKDKKIVAFNLGVLYATINTIDDNTKSIKYFKESAFKEAYFNMGVNYYIGLGVKENNKDAYVYFKKAADEGLERAKFNINQMKKLNSDY
jgi:hypothetical protein